MDYTQLAQNLGTFLIGSGIIAFVAKSLFQYSLDKGLANHKVLLDRHVEEYKHDLQLLMQQHRIQYSKLHSDRAEVIKDLYQRLVTMQNAMGSYMSPWILSPEQPREERQASAVRAFQDFFNYFDSNQIFFNPSVCALINEMGKLYADAWASFSSYDDKASKDFAAADPDFRKERSEAWKSALATINEKIPPVRQSLELEFRILLGVVKVT